MFLFVDNSDKLQIVCDIRHNCVKNMRGVADGFELNISGEYCGQANDFLEKNSTLGLASDWQKQIDWISRLREYCKLYDSRKYDSIDAEQLVKDIAYNGYDLHCKNYQKIYSSGAIYYPIIKRELLLKPMLKPMVAKFLNCSTREVFVGKYNGNGKDIKYIVGDLVSSNIAVDNSIERIYGSINFKCFGCAASKIPADSVHAVGGNIDINLVDIMRTNCFDKHDKEQTKKV